MVASGGEHYSNFESSYYDTTAPGSSFSSSEDSMDPESLPSNDIFAAYKSIHGYASILVCIIGLCANLCNVVVLTRPKMASTVNYILVAIAACDSSVMISCVVYVCHFVLVERPLCEQSTYGWTWFMLLYSNTSIIMRSGGLWLSVAIAILRYRVLALHVFNVVDKPLACKIIGAILTTMVLVNVPIFMSYTIQEMPSYEVLHHEMDAVSETSLANNSNNTGFGDLGNDSASEFLDECSSRTLYVIVSTRFASAVNEGAVLKLSFWINGVCNKLLPCVILCYTIPALIFRMHRRANKQRELITNPNTSLHPTAPLLSAILGLTLLVEIPHATLSVLAAVLPDVYIETYRQAGDLIDLFTLLNSSTTFVLYCSTSKAFRNTFIAVLLPRRKRQCRCRCRCRCRENSNSSLTATRPSSLLPLLPLKAAAATASNSCSNSNCSSSIISGKHYTTVLRNT